MQDKRHASTLQTVVAPAELKKLPYPIIVGKTDDVALCEAGEVPHRRLQHRSGVADLQEVDRLRLELDERALVAPHARAHTHTHTRTGEQGLQVRTGAPGTQHRI